MTRHLKTISQFAEQSAFTEPQLRYWIYTAGQNGLHASGAIVRCGRRVYLDVNGFDRWLVAQNPGLRDADERPHA